MTPSYCAGQLIFAVWPWRALAKDDVVVFEHNGLEKIKRIGHIQPDGLYVIGDYIQASTDSRAFGLVSPASVLGVVVWPKRLPAA